MARKRKRLLLSKILSKHTGRTLQFQAFVPDEPYPIGAITAVRRRFDGNPVYQVGLVDVSEHARRRQVATRLYEVLAREACNRGAQLLSLHRIKGSPSKAFWSKQIRKGRAKRLTTNGGDVAFLLDCSFTTLEGSD